VGAIRQSPFLPTVAAVGVPRSCESIREAIERLFKSTGHSREKIAGALWRAVDDQSIVLLIFTPEGAAEIEAGVTREIHALRLVMSLVYLRSMRPRYWEFRRRFGPHFHQFPLGFAKSEIAKVERQLLGSHRQERETKEVGRPEIADIKPVIKEIVDAALWQVGQPLKVLVTLVIRKRGKVSSDTVSRALDKIYKETRDERFNRPRRRRAHL
jgi:hypothetical protein